MRIAVDQFRGELPRLASRALPDGYAEAAQSARLLSADLQPWNNNLFVLDLPKTGIINAVHLMFRQFWLHWTQAELAAGQVSVDVALGAVPADVTERTYFTGTIGGPRVTNVERATTGGTGGTYPYGSYLLGVTAPVDAPFIDALIYINDYSQRSYDDGSTIAAWTVSDPAFVTQSAIAGNPAPSYQITYPGGVATAKYMFAPFEVQALPGFAIRYDVNGLAPFAGTGNKLIFGADIDGDGIYVSVSQSNGLSIGTITAWAGGTAVIVSNSPSGITLPSAAFHQVTVFADVRGAETIVTVEIADPTGAVISSGTATVPKLPKGIYAGIVNDGAPFSYTFNFDNFRTYEAVDAAAQSARSYAYTYVNAFFEEGVPSPLSATVTVTDGEAVLVSNINDPSPSEITDRGLVKKYLYRAATSDSGTQLQFVDEISIGTTTYTDTKTDAQLGEVLESDLYELPPVDGFSILSLPNGVTVMASKNQVCPSVQNRPHAYPLIYRLTTAYRIVALGNIDTNIIVATEGGIQIVSGTDPSRLSMSDPLLPQGCVSKRSLSSLRGFGVMYASQNGLIGVNAVGGASVVTEEVISEREWKLLNPASIIAATHDDRYYGFYDNGTTQGGFIFDPKQGGNGWSWLDFHAQAVFNDPLADALYLVIDNELYQWDGAAPSRPYRWRSKLYQLPRAANLRACQVRASDYSSLTLRLFENGVQYYTRAVTSEMEFVLPGMGVTRFQFELAGTARVNSVQFAEDMEELL